MPIEAHMFLESRIMLHQQRLIADVCRVLDAALLANPELITDAGIISDVFFP